MEHQHLHRAMQAPSLDLVDVEYSACSVSACPNNRSIVACGLYQVMKDEEAEQIDESSPVTKRVGRCLLMYMDEQGHLREMHRVEQSAILDMAWSRETGKNTLALANSTGQVCLYDLEDEKLMEKQKLQVSEKTNLCLSLDWDNCRSRARGSIVASVSNGTIAIIRGEGELEVEQTWKAHDYEPWIAAFDYWDTEAIWTGGDDCKLKLWDLRQGTSRPAALNKDFTAGVTTIQSNPHVENIFSVGSYDGVVRIFDKRNFKSTLQSHDVGGGVWRVRWHLNMPRKLLTACMHDGFKILDYEPDYTVCKTSRRFDEHGKDALAYGADWAASNTNGGDLIATCSFYDHQLRSWQS